LHRAAVAPAECTHRAAVTAGGGGGAQQALLLLLLPTWSKVLMVGDRPPCTQKIWLSMIADKLQRHTSIEQQQQGAGDMQQPAVGG
jgi:hypothetical protein